MERKKKSVSGFTLAELLIVVAIIAVLVAIAIPIFTSQLEKSREAVDLSDVRSAYAEVMMAAITGDTTAIYTKDSTQTIYDSQKNEYSITVQPLKQKQDGWQTALPITIGGVSSSAGSPYWIGEPGPNGYCKVTYHPAVGSMGEYVSFEWSGGNSGTSGGTSGGDGGTGGGSGDSGENSTPEPGKPSITPGSNEELWTKLNSSSIDYPKTGTFDVICGNVYKDNGTLYVAKRDFENADTAWVAPTKPNNEYVFVQYSGVIYNSSNEYDKNEHKIANVKVGDIYKADNGDIYICLVDSSNELTPMSGNYNGQNWQKINKQFYESYF